MKYQKQKHDDDNRALLEKELDAFIGKDLKKPLNPFVELVKNKKELELCFRGNSNPRVTIYSQNHIIFTVLVSGRMEISFNHARYCENWKEYFDVLCKTYKFNGKIDKTKSGDITVGTMSRSLQNNDPLNYEQILSLYKDVIKPIFDRYFYVEGKEGIKDYFKHGKIVKVGGKTEKKRQQELYSKFKNRYGYFFYDLEFAQRHRNLDEQRKDIDNNKPDMQAIKFDKKGKPERIVFVEVKCTKEAMTGGSGISTHFDKMQKNIKKDLEKRRKEACDILNQYAQLGLRGLTASDVFEYVDFKDLKPEILLLFTDDAKKIWETDESYKDVKKKTSKIESDDSEILLYKYND